MKRMLPALLFLLCLLHLPCSANAGQDLDKAIKIGSGKTMVIEYTDPDCPFCRRASAFFRNRRDVTRYIFLNPLPIHPQAKEKAQYILSAPDKAKAYEEVMTGKFDGKKPGPVTRAGIQLQEEHAAIAREAKARSTPTFAICGRIVVGFDQPKLEAALGK